MDQVGQGTFIFGLNFRGWTELFAQKDMIMGPSLHDPANFTAKPLPQMFLKSSQDKLREYEGLGVNLSPLLEENAM